MDFFKVSNHPLWVGLPSLGGDLPFLGGEFCLGGVAPS